MPNWRLMIETMLRSNSESYTYNINNREFKCQFLNTISSDLGQFKAIPLRRHGIGEYTTIFDSSPYKRHRFARN